MPPAKIDRRTERTRTALMSAFIHVLLSEGYEAVTVEHVAEQANIGRSTFYMHYTGKEAILRESLTRPSSILSLIVGHDVPAEMLVKQLEHFHEQRQRNHIFFAGPVRVIWVDCLAQLIAPRLAIVARNARARPILPLPLVARQIAEQQLALIANWLTGKTGPAADAVAEALIAGTRATLAALLRCRADAALLIPGEKLRFQLA
jgi:AcrR family transcriptional regulator